MSIRLAPATGPPYHCRVTAPALVAHAVRLPQGCDPLALLALTGAAEGERAFWSAFDSRVAMAAIGAADVASAAGPGRMAAIARHIAATRDRLMHAGDAPADVRWLGGFAFAPAPPLDPWAAFGAARFVLPEALVVRRGTSAHLTAFGPADQAGRVAARARALAEQLAAWPRDEPASTHAPPGPPAAGFDIAIDADALASRLGEAVGAIRRGEAAKVVLGVTHEVPLVAAPDAVALLSAMASGAPGCTRFLVAPSADGALIGATPERLVAVAGRRLRTMALAGTAPRGHDARADAAFGRALLASAKDRAEHAHVVTAIREDLAGADVASGELPRLRRLATLQHLETPIHARLPARGDVLAEAARLHPTPALGGRPRATALALIDRLETESRGWFGGAVGWLDGRGDGDLAVVIRSLLLCGSTATAFAGAGLVADSDPVAEAHEIALKLRAAFAPIAALAAGAGQPA